MSKAEEALDTALQVALYDAPVDALVTNAHEEELREHLLNALPGALASFGYYIAPIAQPTSPGARSTDPRTSHKAVPGVMRRNSQRHILLQTFARYPEGLTDEEAMERSVGVSENSEYATRCSELRNAGWIRDTGEDRKGNSGTPRIVSEITEAGLAELRRLG